MLLLWLSLALAEDPELVSGFDRLFVDPLILHVEPVEFLRPMARADLRIDNPHTARARVLVGDQPVGDLLPKAQGMLRDVLAGTYVVRFELPSGAVRTERVDAR